MEYGAMIERGEISAAEGEKYRVRSLSRDGIESLALPLMQKMCSENEEEYAVGDRVYYFMFPDGTGGIIGKFES